MNKVVIRPRRRRRQVKALRCHSDSSFGFRGSTTPPPSGKVTAASSEKQRKARPKTGNRKANQTPNSKMLSIFSCCIPGARRKRGDGREDGDSDAVSHAAPFLSSFFFSFFFFEGASSGPMLPVMRTSAVSGRYNDMPDEECLGGNGSTVAQ